MGEARRRGTFEERKAAAIKRDRASGVPTKDMHRARRRRLQVEELAWFRGVFSLSPWVRFKSP